MVSVLLQFTSGPAEVALEHAVVEIGGETLAVYRGQAVVAHRSTVFPWSSAVRALCILLLRYIVNPDEENATLVGEARSHAAALDSAISKEPQWLVDLFGVDVGGRSRARKLFYRLNPERKRPGPVTIGVRTGAIPRSNIRIKVDGEPVKCPSELSTLLEQLGGEKVAAAEGTGNLQEGPLLRHFREAAVREVVEMLDAVDIFSNSGLQGLVSRICNYSFYRGLGVEDVIAPCDFDLSPSARLGQLHGALPPLPEQGLSVATSPALISANAVLSALEDRMPGALHIHYKYPYSGEVVDLALRPDENYSPDLLVLPVAVACKLAKRADCPYRPLMVLPPVSHRMLSHANGVSLKGARRVSVFKEYPATSVLVLEEKEKGLQACGIKPEAVHMEHAEVSREFSDSRSDLITIQWFPNHFFFNLLFKAAPIPGCEAVLPKETRLFAHERILSNKKLAQALSVLLRDAWLRLRGSREEVRRAVERLLGYESYFDILARAAGVTSSHLSVFEERASGAIRLVANG